MSHSHSDDLIARGRKAGLSTRELYAALSSRQPEPSDDDQGRSDAMDTSPHRRGRQARLPALSDTER